MTVRYAIQLRWAWWWVVVWLICDIVFSYTGLPWESSRTLKDRLDDLFTIAFFLAGLSIFARDKVALLPRQREKS